MTNYMRPADIFNGKLKKKIVKNFKFFLMFLLRNLKKNC